MTDTPSTERDAAAYLADVSALIGEYLLRETNAWRPDYHATALTHRLATAGLLTLPAPASTVTDRDDAELTPATAYGPHSYAAVTSWDSPAGPDGLPCRVCGLTAEDGRAEHTDPEGRWREHQRRSLATLVNGDEAEDAGREHKTTQDSRGWYCLGCSWPDAAFTVYAADARAHEREHAAPEVTE